jgi:hypothetical protein
MIMQSLLACMLVLFHFTAVELQTADVWGEHTLFVLANNPDTAKTAQVLRQTCSLCTTSITGRVRLRT